MSANPQALNFGTTPQAARETADANPLSKLPRLLRGVGATVLLTSVSIFLFRGWEGGDDVYRYCLLLLQTAGLAALSLVTAHFIGEGKGARLLYMLALACVPANFAILGGFLYATFGSGPFTAVTPEMFSWSTASATSALLITGFSTLLLLPLAVLGFRVLTRYSYASLSQLFLIGNLALLVPLRVPALVGIAALTMCIAVLFRLAAIKQTDRTLSSIDGVIARVLVFAPIAVFVGRNLWIHHADSALVMSLALMAYSLLRYLSMEIVVQPQARQVLEVAAVGAALTAAGGAMGILEPTSDLTSAFTLPVGGLVCFALLSELGTRASAHRVGYRLLGSLILASLLLANVVLMHSVIAAATCITFGLLLLGYGAMAGQRAPFLAGASCAVVGVSDQLLHVVLNFDLGSWGTLGMVGISAILLGSVLERQGAALRAQWIAMRGRYQAWQL